MLGESERKFEDISRKFGTMESDMVHATERAENQENKIIDLEEELKVRRGQGIVWGDKN